MPPSTPTSQSTAVVTAVVSTPTPGNWTHPRFEEIMRRKQAATFDHENFKKISWNGVALLVLWGDKTLPREMYGFPTNSSDDMLIPNSPLTLQAISPITLPASGDLIRQLISLVFLWNIFVASMPLWRSVDTIEDIPLTPSQRNLLGLDPNSSTPATPDTHYITPPRYTYTPSPQTSNSTSRHSGNANSRRGSSSGRKQMGGSPYSPSASPLWQKAMEKRDQSRRHSYGSHSPLGPGTPSKELGLLSQPHTPSPSMGRGASVALNSKWLYERGRASPGSRNIYS